MAAMTASIASSVPAANVAVCLEQAGCFQTTFVRGKASEEPNAGVSRGVVYEYGFEWPAESREEVAARQYRRGIVCRDDHRNRGPVSHGASAYHSRDPIDRQAHHIAIGARDTLNEARCRALNTIRTGFVEGLPTRNVVVYFAVR